MTNYVDSKGHKCDRTSQIKVSNRSETDETARQVRSNVSTGRSHQRESVVDKGKGRVKTETEQRAGQRAR